MSEAQPVFTACSPQIKYADEFRRAVAGERPPTPAAEDDETVRLVTEEIEQTTKDFVLKRLATELKGHAFAEFVAHLLGAMGYRTRVSPAPSQTA